MKLTFLVTMLMAVASTNAAGQSCAASPDFPNTGALDLKLNTSGSWRINANAGEMLIVVGDNPLGFIRFPGGRFSTKLYNPSGSLAGQGFNDGSATRLPTSGTLTLATTGAYCLTASFGCGGSQCTATDGTLSVLRSTAATPARTSCPRISPSPPLAEPLPSIQQSLRAVPFR